MLIVRRSSDRYSICLKDRSSYRYDAANRLMSTGGSAYTNDADGNTLSDGTRTSVWDSQNRLVSCTAGGTVSTYTYGADGLRRSSTVNGVTTYYVYDGSMMVREMKQNAQGVLQPTATYLQGPRGPEYRRDDTQAEGTYTDASGTQYPAGKTRWYVYDGLGSVVGEVDPSGNLTSSGTFDVYGAKRQGGTGAATSRQGFVGSLGHVSDAETGLVYMRARYYDPNVGRFVSQDPKRSGLNWYAYCGNDPVNKVDSSGQEESVLHDVIEFGAGCLMSKTFLGTMAMGFLSLLVATVWVAGVGAGAILGPGGMIYGGVAAYYASAPIIGAIVACGQFAAEGMKEAYGSGGGWGAAGIAREVVGICLGYQAGLDLFMKADEYAQEQNR